MLFCDTSALIKLPIMEMGSDRMQQASRQAVWRMGWPYAAPTAFSWPPPTCWMKTASNPCSSPVFSGA